MLLYILIISGIVILDMLSKYLAVLTLSRVTTLPIIPNVLHLTYVENTGAAFSIFSDKQLFLIIISLVLIAFLFYLLFTLPKKKSYRLIRLALSIIIGGAIGNLIDRVFLGYVRDFIDFRLINFAVFNIADAFVVCGALLLLYAYLKPIKKTSKPVKSEKEEEDIEKKEVKQKGFSSLTHVKKKKQPEVRPVIRTELKRLPDRRPVSFSPSPIDDQDENIKIYTPRRERERRQATDIIQTDVIEAQLAKMAPEQTTVPVQKPARRRRKNRYSQSADAYAESISKQRKARKKKEAPVWNPESGKAETKKPVRKESKPTSVQSPSVKPKRKGKRPGTIPDWNPTTVSYNEEKKETPKKRSNSVTPQWYSVENRPKRNTVVEESKVQERKKTTSKQTKSLSTWEPERNPRKRTRPAGTLPDWEPEKEEAKEEKVQTPSGIPKRPKKKGPKVHNRYETASDQYAESINELKNKRLTKEKEKEKE